MHTDSFLSERAYRFQVIWMTKNRSNPLGAKNNDSHSQKQAIVIFYTMKYRKSGNFNSKNDSRLCRGASAILKSVDFTAFAENVKTVAPTQKLYQSGHAIWGIGRELYTAPFIWVPAANVTVKKNGDKLCCSDRFSVRSIAYNRDREIASLVITNDSNQGRVVYEFREKEDKPVKNADAREKNKRQGKTVVSNAGELSDAQMQSLEEELRRTGVEMEAVQERYKIKNPYYIPDELYRKIMAALAKTKSKAA